MRLRKIIQTILGPSKEMVEAEYRLRQMNREAESDRDERREIYARIKAIEVSLPIADRRD